MAKLGMVLMLIGILIFAVAGADIVSILLMIVEKIFSMNLNSSYFSSISFRIILLLVGGGVLLLGGLFNKNSKKCFIVNPK